jgi:hypothetical protein
MFLTRLTVTLIVQETKEASIAIGALKVQVSGKSQRGCSA